MGGSNNKVLFWASFLTLIAAGIGFSIRNALLQTWGQAFGFTQTELGSITGAGLWGFPVAIIALSFVADRLGYGPLMALAFILHSSSAVITLAATPVYQAYGKDMAYLCLYWGSFTFALANGTCEAVINPLTATLFPTSKTHWLNILHAGWPGGLVLGALLGLLFNRFAVRWEVQMGMFLVPTLCYGVMMVGRGFPKSEASASGVTMANMIGTLVAPLLLFLFFMHALVGYVELGTDSWIVNITNTVLSNQDKALLAFIWTNVLMFGLRFFAGPIVHKISPLGLLFCSAAVGTTGLLLLGLPDTNTTWLWLGAVTVYGIGKTFYWPTMLGVVSERFPRGGALALGITGGIGMLSAGLLGSPLIGYKQDYAATRELETGASDTYLRYKSDTASAPLPGLPPIAGLDNGKVGVLDDYEGLEAQKAEGKEPGKLKLYKDLELLAQQKKTEKELEDRKIWWEAQGERNAERDSPRIKSARLNGGKTALTWTAFVPALMALGFLILIFYFRAKGGYQAEVLLEHKAEDEKFTGGTIGPGEG